MMKNDSPFAVRGAKEPLAPPEKRGGKGCSITPAVFTVSLQEVDFFFSVLSAFGCEVFFPPELERLSSGLTYPRSPWRPNVPSPYPVTRDRAGTAVQRPLLGNMGVPHKSGSYLTSHIPQNVAPFSAGGRHCSDRYLRMFAPEAQVFHSVKLSHRRSPYYYRL
jgi:hypothetical protein